MPDQDIAMRVLLFTSTLAFVNLRPTSSQAIVTAALPPTYLHTHSNAFTRHFDHG